MKLRTALFLGVLVLIGAVMATTVVVVSLVIDRSARAQVEAGLLASRNVFLELHARDQENTRYQVSVVAGEPRLKAVVDSEDADRDTVLDVARTLHKTGGTDLFLVADGDGFLLADVLHPDDEGADLSSMPVVARALEKGRASAIWSPPGRLFRVAARRMNFGQRVSGVLIIGHSIGDEAAAATARQVGSPVAVLLDDDVVAVAGLDGVGRDRVAKALGGIDPTSRTPARVDLGGTTFLAQGGQFEDYAGDRRLRYVVLRDLDEALAPGTRVIRILFLVVAVAVLAAVVLAVIVSRRLSRPMDQLMAFTAAVGSGHLDLRAEVGGLVETRVLGQAMNRMVRELAESRDELAEKQRLEGELEIAQRIQTSILPRERSLANLALAAVMDPADEVGGDYYDVLPVAGGGWVAIGDVSGHGLTAGLVMMMIQTGVASLVEAEPDGSPADLVTRLNRVIYDNVQARLEAERHATMTLFRYHDDGRLVWAGAHMDIIVLRAGAERCDEIRTPGTWLGMIDDIADVTEDSEMVLGDGDVVVLYTDGLTEAMDASGEQMGTEPVCRVVEQHRDDGVEALRDAILARLREWTSEQVDDITVLVMRYRSDTSVSP